MGPRSANGIKASRNASATGRLFAAVCALVLVVTGTWASTLPGVAATDPEEWQVVSPPIVAEPATLEPSTRSADGIPVDASFTLTSLGAKPAAALAEQLSVHPPVALVRRATGDPAVVRLSPTEPLDPGRSYRFELRNAVGGLEGSWVYRTQAPLQVIGTVPGHHRDHVRPDTGIEITFDHAEPIAPERHFSIEPAVSGRFEIHGSTLVFVPRRRLDSGTRYTVSLSPGLSVKGSTAQLEEPFSFSFQTRSALSASRRDREPAVGFVAEVGEAAPGQAPVLEVWVRRPAQTKSVEVLVHQLPGLTDAIDAVRTIQDGSDWGEVPHLSISHDGLRQVGRLSGSLRQAGQWDRSRQALTLSRALPRGWYLLTIEDPLGDRQAILQVSDLAAYAHVTNTDTLFWVNSTASGGPVQGAEVSVVGGASMGTTDRDGLLVTETPETLTSNDPVPLVLVRSEEGSLLLPFAIGARWDSPNVERTGYASPPSERFWTYLTLDREGYRSTDTVNAWGMVRSRDDGSVPGEVELRLYRSTDAYWEDRQSGPAIATITVAPADTGVFSASLAYEDLPLGGYVVEARTEGERFAREWLDVRSIVKPAYRLALATDRRAFMDGEPIDVSVEASFFDGTAVPAAPLSVISRQVRRAPTTDATGTARTTVRALFQQSPDQQIGFQQVQARPRSPEQGEITAGTEVAVVGSGLYLTGDAVLERGRVRVSGKVHRLDLDRLDRQMTRLSANEAMMWQEPTVLDPRGRPAPGARVTARVTEIVWVRRRTGTVYDFVAKRTIPRFEWESRNKQLGSFDLVADADGTFDLEVEGDPQSGFRVDLSAADGQGRIARQRLWAERPWRYDPGAQPYLALLDGEDENRWGQAAVGDELRIELRQGQGRLPRGEDEHYLFLIQHRGLRDHIVQHKPVLDMTFSDDLVPSASIGAVRFTGDSYVAVPDGLHLGFEARTRELGLEIETTAEHYAPGETVELAVRTTDPDGQPVSASVVLHAIDEKLYAMGLVGAPDPLEDIYADVGSGLVRTYASHQRPGTTAQQDGKGDTAGGGSPRSDFRDLLLFRQVETDADGQATVRFDTSDDLTSWRIVGSGVSQDIEVGTNAALVSVGLPFFVDIVAADDYLVTDEPRISLRSYGSSLAEDDEVTFSLEAPSLGLDPTTLSGRAFRPQYVSLPTLTEGTHDLTVSASAVIDGVEYRDAVVRPIHVRSSRLVSWRSEHVLLEPGMSVPGAGSLTAVTIADEGRGRFLAPLVTLAGAGGPRADRALAAVQARRSLERWFPDLADEMPAAPFDAAQFQRGDGSIALVPYGGSDEAVSFLVALAAPETVDRERLAHWFRRIQGSRKTTRERALRAAVARSAAGSDVLADLDSIAAEGPLAPADLLTYAVGLAAGGDHARALDIEGELLADYGQRQGERIRLRLPRAESAADATSQDVAWDTAMLAILAAELGDDDTARAADAYVRAEGAAGMVAALQHVGVIDRLMERAEAAPASFTLEVDLDRRTVDLDPGDVYGLTLTADQRAATELSPVQGLLGMTSTWAEPLAQGQSDQAPGISVQRSVRPRGRIVPESMVEVTIEVRLGSDAVSGCYLVTDMAPSGLAPLRDTVGWPRRKADATPPRTQGPLSVEGQRVDFCVAKSKEPRVHTLRYLARVVTPGAYAWEPTMVQSTEVPSLRRLGEPSTLVIDTPGELAPAVGEGDAPGTVADPASKTRRQLENELMGRLSAFDCGRWREDDQPFERGALAAIQCDQPDYGLSQVALFQFPDAETLRSFWDWRVDQVDLPPDARDTGCSDGRPGLVVADDRAVVCYLSGAGTSVAKIRWLDAASATYGVADADDDDLAALYAWWFANHGSRP